MATTENSNDTRSAAGGAARSARDRRERIRQARRAPWRAILLVSGVILVAAAILVARHVLDQRSPAITELVVTCKDDSGAALRGVAVAFYDSDYPLEAPVFETSTDEQGRAILPKERATGGFYCLGRSAKLGAVAQCWVEQGEPEAELQLSEAKAIDGAVEDEEGIPVPDAEIEARLVGGPVLERTRSDEKGGFRLAHIAKTTLHVELTVKHSGHEHARGTWWRRSRGALVMTLTRSKPLSFRVLGPEGAAMAGLPLRLAGQEYKDYVARTDARGECSFEGLRLSDNYFVLIDHPSLTYRWRGFSPKAKWHTIKLQEPATLVGVAVDAGGTPRPGVELRHRHGPRRWVRTRTDDVGRFRIGDLPRGVVEIHWETHKESGVVSVDVPGARVTSGKKLVLE